MAGADDSISAHLQLSLDDLSNELSALGLKPLKQFECSNLEEVCEKLLNTSWRLINLVHSHAFGISENSHNNSERELLLLSEKQSLNCKLEHLNSEMVVKEKMLAQERENIRKLLADAKKLSSTTQKQKQMISQLTAQLETKEQDFKHETAKQQVECEQLREMVRKSLGVAIRPQTVIVGKLGDALGSVSLSDENAAKNELSTLQQGTINRLKSVNQTLVSENLMLRDALRMLHLDISQLLEDADKHLEEDQSSCLAMTDGIFRLPLAYCMKKLSEMRLHQIGKLNVILKYVYSNCSKITESS